MREELKCSAVKQSRTWDDFLKVLCHRKRKIFCMLTKNSHWLWNPIQLCTTQLTQGTVTLGGRAGNVSVAKQWQTGGCQRSMPGWAGKDVQASCCNAVEDGNKIFSCLKARGFQQANTSQQELVWVCGTLLANVQTEHMSASNPQPHQTPSSSSSSTSYSFSMEGDKLMLTTHQGRLFSCKMTN